MIDLNKDTFYALVASSVSVIGPFFLMVVSAILLNPDAFAANAKNLYIVMLFVTVVSLQLQNILLRLDPLNSIRDDLVRMAVLTMPRIVLGIICCYALFFLLASIQKFEFDYRAFSLLVLVSIVYQAYLGLINILIRRMAVKKQVFAQLFFLGGQMLCLIILSYISPDSGWIRIVSILIAIALLLIFCLSSLPCSGNKNNSLYYINWDIEKYAIWLIPLAISNFILGYFDKAYASNSLTGDYAKEYLIISHIFSAFVILPTAINRLVIPKIFDGHLSIYVMKSSKGFVLIAGLALAFVIMGGIIYAMLKFIFESTLDSVGLIVCILVITQIARALYLILVTELHRQYRSAIITIIAVFSAMFYMALTFVYHDRGLIAICLSAFAAQFLQMLGVVFYVASNAKKSSRLA